ncbi:MAG: TetR/AcrR family transcriptional regulator [Patulibacter sp.]
MAIERTGHGDPARTVALLWGDNPTEGRANRGPRARLDTREIADAAVALADARGLAALTMRALAAELGLASPNALYTYVPSKAELIDMVVDRCLAEFVLDTPAEGVPLPPRIAGIAEANLAVYRAHPWLADVAQDRPPLGPAQLRKYERELASLTGAGLGDLDADLTLGLITSFVRAHASQSLAAARTEDEGAWWAQAGPALAQRVRAEDFPHASRVGTAVGEAQGRATDPDLGFRFGVERIAAGVEALAGLNVVLRPGRPFRASDRRP